MHGREPTFRSGGQLTNYSSATDYWADLTNREAHGEAMTDYWDDLKSEEQWSNDGTVVQLYWAIQSQSKDSYLKSMETIREQKY